MKTITKSRNVREGRYNGYIGGKHCRSRGECLRYRVSTPRWLSWAYRNGYISFIHTELTVQELLKGEGPYPDSVMEGELGQFGGARFVFKDV